GTSQSRTQRLQTRLKHSQTASTTARTAPTREPSAISSPPAGIAPRSTPRPSPQPASHPHVGLRSPLPSPANGSSFPPAASRSARTTPTTGSVRIRPSSTSPVWRPTPTPMPPSAAFPRARPLIPAGCLKLRSNGTDYRLRAHSASIHLPRLATDSDPDAVLVFEPTDDVHEVTLYFRPRAGADTEEFFSDSRYGEYWVGPRADLEAMATMTGIATENSATVDDAITKDLGSISVRLVRQADTRVDGVIDLARTQVQADLETSEAGDAEL